LEQQLGLGLFRDDEINHMRRPWRHAGFPKTTLALGMR
jgi:hypothetical protein